MRGNLKAYSRRFFFFFEMIKVCKRHTNWVNDFTYNDRKSSNQTDLTPVLLHHHLLKQLLIVYTFLNQSRIEKSWEKYSKQRR